LTSTRRVYQGGDSLGYETRRNGELSRRWRHEEEKEEVAVAVVVAVVAVQEEGQWGRVACLQSQTNGKVNVSPR